MKNSAQNHQDSPKSGVHLFIQIESCPYEEMGEYNGIAFIPSPDEIIEGKFYVSKWAFFIYVFSSFVF